MYRPFAFHGKLPGEVRHFIENNPAARRLFTVTGDPSAAGGADAFGKLGDRYFDIVRRIAGSDLKAAKETARHTNDPAMQFWGAVHHNLPPAKERRAQQAVDPQTLNVGQEFELNGHRFQVVEDADGYRVLRDGDDYPETPIGALEGDKIPIDRGTLTAAREPELPQGDPFAEFQEVQLRRDELERMTPRALHELVKARGLKPGGKAKDVETLLRSQSAATPSDVAGPSPRPSPGSTGERQAANFFDADAAGMTPRESGIFGQEIFDRATGRDTGALFHEPTQAAPVSRAAEDARYAGRFDEAATPSMFGRNDTEPPPTGSPAPSTPPTPQPITTARVEARALELMRDAESAGTPLARADARKRASYQLRAENLRAAEPQVAPGAPVTGERIQARRAVVIMEAKARGEELSANAASVEARRQLEAERAAATGDTRYNPSAETPNAGPNQQRPASIRPAVEGDGGPLSSDGQRAGVRPRRARDSAGRRAGAEQHLRDKLPDDFRLDPAPDGWVIAHPDGTRTAVRYVDDIDPATVPDETFAASLIAKIPGASIEIPDGRRVAVPQTVREFLALDADVRAGIREVYAPVGYTDVGSGDVVVSGKHWDVEGTIDEELFHAAYRRLSAEDRRKVMDTLRVDEPVLAEELAYTQLWQRPRDPYPGMTPGEQVIYDLRRLNVFRTGQQARPDGGFRLSTSQGEGPSRNPMRPRGAVNVGPLQTPVDVAAAAVGVVKRGFDWWTRPLIGNVEAQGGDFGKRLANAMRRANDHAREVLGELHAPAKAYLDAVSGAPGRNFFARRRAIGELQRRVSPPGVDGYGFSQGQLAVEGRVQLNTLSPEAQEIVRLRRDLTERIGKMAAAHGVQVVDPKLAAADKTLAKQATSRALAAKKAWEKLRIKKGANDPAAVQAKADWQTERTKAKALIQKARAGGVRPFVPTKDGMRWIRAFTPEFHTIARLPDGNPLKQALAKAIADANGIPTPVAVGHVNGLAEGPLFKRNATETVRLLEHFPAFVKHPQTGRWVEVLNVDPFTSGKQLVDNAALRLGYVNTFGQDLPGRSVSADLVEEFSKAGGRPKDAQDVIRALNGVPLDHLDLGRFQPEPGTAGYEAVRALGTTYHLFKSAALTTAAVPNVLEPFTKTLAFAGVRPWVAGLYAVARHPFASRELTAAIGARTVDQMRWATRPGHRGEDVARGVGAILTAPLKMVNEWNELHAATTGMALASRIRAGKQQGAARVTLEVLGFSPQQIDRLVNARGLPEEYRAIATRFAERTQGSTSNPSERSRAGNNALWRMAVPFDSWAQMTGNRTASVLAALDSAIRSREPARVARATELAAKHVFGAAATGAGAAFLYAWLNGGAAGVDIKAREAKDDPAGFVIESLTNALLGGAAGRLLRAVESPRSTSTVERFQSVSYPAMMLQDAVEAFNGWGRYKDQTPAERAAGFLRNRFAINRAMTNVLAAWGLTDHNRDQEAAISAFYRWRREQPDIDQQLGGEHLPSPERIAFRRQMKDALAAMKSGDEFKAQQAITEATKLSKTGAKGVAASLRPRRLLAGLDDDQRARLRRHVGDAAFRRLEAYDDLLESWALSVRFETDANPGVHARHGAGLLSLDEQRDAVEREYEPVKAKLTGNRYEDMGVTWDNRDLVDRRKAINAKFNRLEDIRRALNNDPKAPWQLKGLSVEELDAEMRAVLSE